MGNKPLLAVCFVLLAGGGFAAGPNPVAEISITPGQISWTTKINAEKWLLTVSGQGIYLREEVDSGEPLRLQPNAHDGERLANGIYIWELRAIGPEHLDSNSERERMPASIRQRSARREVAFERFRVERPVVTFGSFRVEGGGFVIPAPEEAYEGR